MKRFFFFILFLSLSSVIHAEKKVSEYYLSYFNKTYEIQATEPKNGVFEFYIYCHSKDDQTIGFSIESKDIPEFINALNKVKLKFNEWSKTAKENNVSEFDKDFDIKFKSVTAFFSYGRDWHFSFQVKMKPYFKVTKTGDHLIVFDSGELTASDNRYMDVEGFMLAFSSEKEIDDFIKAIDVDSVLKAESNKNKVDDLFK